MSNKRLSVKILERREHQLVVPFDKIPKECNLQHTFFEVGGGVVETIHGFVPYFDNLVDKALHILKNPSRHACIVLKIDTQGVDRYALYVNDVSVDPQRYDKHISMLRNKKMCPGNEFKSHYLGVNLKRNRKV